MYEMNRTSGSSTYAKLVVETYVQRHCAGVHVHPPLYFSEEDVGVMIIWTASSIDTVKGEGGY